MCFAAMLGYENPWDIDIEEAYAAREGDVSEFKKYILEVGEFHYEELIVEAENEDAAFDMINDRVDEFITTDTDTEYYSVTEIIDGKHITRKYEPQGKVLKLVEAAEAALAQLVLVARIHGTGTTTIDALRTALEAFKGDAAP